MPSKAKADHSSRIVGDDEVECACGKKLDDDAAWRRHYERETTAAERKTLEGRDGD